jgi:hypothetical protein
VVLATPGERRLVGHAHDGVRVYGTPYGNGATVEQRRRNKPLESRRRYAGHAVVAGLAKGVLVRPEHGRGIGPNGTGTVPHDSLSTITDKVKQMDMQECRAERIEGINRLRYDRAWATMEMDKRDAAGMDGSRAALAARKDALGPPGHGPTIIPHETRAAIDALRKELGLDVAMTAAEVVSEARQQFKLEDIELPIAEDAARLMAALRRGGVACQAAGGRGGSATISVGRISTRPLR